MADIHIQRHHHLGLGPARDVARRWTHEAREKFAMECTVIEGEVSDTVTFKRSGVKGSLIVAADHFDLQATLGFLLGAFSQTIKEQIEKNLDELLAEGAQAAASGRTHGSKVPGRGR